MNFEGKVALICAAAKGIGFATAKKLAEGGAKVYLADFQLELVEESAKSLRDLGYDAHAVYFNAFDRTTHKVMVEEVMKTSDRIDILVNNYGGAKIALDNTILNTDLDYYLEVVNNQIASVFATSQLVIPIMAKNGGGSIINTCSVAGIYPDITSIGYGTGKAAVKYLTQQIAMQVGRMGIRCNSVAPGMTATDAVAKNCPEDYKQLMFKHIPLNRMATPEEIAAAICYFASDEAAFTTGQNITVAGGYSMGQGTYGDFMMPRN